MNTKLIFTYFVLVYATQTLDPFSGRIESDK